MIIETKYGIGDKVWFARTETERRQHPCPDCNGTKQWKAISPAGEEYDFSCPRCSASYSGKHEMSLAYSAYTTSVRQLTIGSIRHDTYKDGFSSGTEYMCVETGVGGGSVYKEGQLFSTKEGAEAAAALMAAEQNNTVEWVVKAYNQSLEVSDYQLSNAGLKIAERAQSEARSLLWNLNDLFSQIDEAYNKDAILELIDDYKRYTFERDKAKVGLLPA
jgi:hypothetical protein